MKARSYVFICEESGYESTPRTSLPATVKAAGQGCCDAAHKVFERTWTDGGWVREEVKS